MKERLCWVIVLLLVVGGLSFGETMTGDLLTLDAEKFTTVKGKVYVGRDRDEGKVVRFENGTDHLQTEVSLSSKASVELWILVYFAWADADTLLVSVDDQETKVYDHRSISSAFWDRGDFGSWHWHKVGKYELAAGSHMLKISAAKRKDQEIDQVVLYSGKEPFFRREEIFGSRAKALKNATAISLPVSFKSHTLTTEKATFLQGKSGNTPSYSYSTLKEDSDSLNFLVDNPKQKKVQVWARVWYRNKNVYDGNILEEFEHVFRFHLNGHLSYSVFETDEKRWHWVELGEYHLTQGKHLLSLDKKGNDVKIESLVLYTGNDVHKEDWFNTPLAHLVPKNLENDIAFEDARTIGGWRFFGSQGNDTKGEFSTKDEQGHLFPLSLALPEKGGTLILQKSRYVESAESWLAAPTKVGVWVNGNNGLENISAILSNSAGESMQLPIGVMDFSGWRMLSGQIPSSFLRQDTTAYPALPVRLTHVVIDKKTDGQGGLVLGESFFFSPFNALSATKKNETSNGDLFDVVVALQVKNLTEWKQTGQVYIALNPISGKGKSVYPKAANFILNGDQEGGVDLSFAAAEGIYRLNIAFSGEKPQEFLLAIGKEVPAATLAQMEKENGGLLVTPLDIPRDKVQEEYGKSFQILSGGLDIASLEYAESKDYASTLVVKGYDLSDEAGWPFIAVPYGQVAFDPQLGRVQFCTGDKDPINIVSKMPLGFGVPGEKFYLRGDFAFISGGEGDLGVIDISSPAEPKTVTFIPHWYFQHTIHFYQNYAYTSSSHRSILLVDDISNPYLPGKMREVYLDREKYTTLSGILEEKKLAAFTGKEGLYFLSLENPFYPKEKLLIEGAEEFIVCEQGKYALTYLERKKKIGLLSLSGDLPKLVKEIDVPAAPGGGDPGTIIAAARKSFAVLLKDEVVVYTLPKMVKLGSISLKDKLQNSKPVVIRDGVFLKDDYLYLMDGRQVRSQHSLNFSSPASRIFVYKIDWNSKNIKEVFTFQEEKPTEYSRITVRGDYAYVSDYNFGLWTFDVSNPAHPRKLGGAPVAAEGHFIGVGDTTALCAGTFGGATYAIDITDPSSLRKKDLWWDGSWYGYDNMFHARIHMKGDVGFLSKPTSIEIVDFSGEKAKRLGQIPCGKSRTYFMIKGDQGYLLSQGTLSVYDISNPEKPEKLGQKPGLIPAGRWGALAKRGDRLYVAVSRDKGFHVVDISDLENIKELGQIRLSDKDIFREASLVLKDQYAITLANYYSHQIRIVDISDDTAPSLVKTIMPLENRGVVDWADFYQGMTSSGKYLFIGGYGQIECYDISNLPEVKLQDKKAFGFQWRAGWLKDGMLYTLGLQGLYVLDVPCGSQLPAEVTMKLIEENAR